MWRVMGDRSFVEHCLSNGHRTLGTSNLRTTPSHHKPEQYVTYIGPPFLVPLTLSLALSFLLLTHSHSRDFAT